MPADRSAILILRRNPFLFATRGCHQVALAPETILLRARPRASIVLAAQPAKAHSAAHLHGWPRRAHLPTVAHLRTSARPRQIPGKLRAASISNCGVIRILVWPNWIFHNGDSPPQKMNSA